MKVTLTIETQEKYSTFDNLVALIARVLGEMKQSRDEAEGEDEEFEGLETDPDTGTTTRTETDSLTCSIERRREQMRSTLEITNETV